VETHRPLLAGAALVLLSLLPVAAIAAAPTVCHPGVQQLARGDYKAALKSLSTVQAKGGSSTELLHSRALAELINGRIDEAIAIFDTVIAAEPQNLEAQFNRSIALLRRSRLDEALAALKSIYAAEGSLRARAAYHAALALDGKRDAAAAEEWLRKSLAAEPDLADAHLYLGILLERRGKFQEAGRAYRDYLNLVPESIVAMLRFGVVAQRAGYTDTAATYFRQIIQRAPDSAEAVEGRKFLVMWE
jgi:tetratricopeptide (TPR) repeat protein